MIYMWKEKLIKAAIIIIKQAQYIDEIYKEEKYKEYGEWVRKIGFIILNRLKEIEYGETESSIREDISWSIYESIENFIGVLWSSIFEEDFANKSWSINEAIEKATEAMSEEISINENNQKVIEIYINMYKKNIDSNFDVSRVISSLQEGRFKEKLIDPKYDSWIEGQCLLSVILFFLSLN